MFLMDSSFNKSLFEKYKNLVLTKARENQLDECIDTIKNIEDCDVKNRVCFSVAKFFAEQGHFKPIQKLVLHITPKSYSPIGAVRKQNDVYSQISIIFAKCGFIQKAKKCAYLIESDWSKSDDFEYSTHLREHTYKEIIEAAIEQKKFQEASELLWLAGRKDHYWLEKEIKQGLGTWQEPVSISSKRYYSSKLHKELTLEELSSEMIKTYAEKRAYSDIDTSDYPTNTFYNPKIINDWKEQKKQEVNRLQQKYLEEFEYLPIEKRCELLQKYIEVNVWDDILNKEREDVIIYLRMLPAPFMEAVD
jgi:hypothetical protein